MTQALRHLASWGLLLLAAWPAAAWAQDKPPASTAALACLTTGGDERPTYPEESFRRKDGGTIRLQLQFDGPDQPPVVKVLNQAPTFDALEAAALTHVAGFRVPCMRAGDPPVVLRQDYVFQPNDGRKVMGTRPADQAQQEEAAQLACVRHVDGQGSPEYLTSARRQEIEGKVLVGLRFGSPDAPPSVHVMAAGHAKLAQSVTAYAQGLRMPCLKGAPKKAQLLYVFQLDGGRRTVLNDVSLSAFLGAVKDLPSAYFDLHTLACPFDLCVTYWQPHAVNRVVELDSTLPQRQAFLDWLSRLRMKLDDAVNTAVLGDSFTISVPCGTVDL